MSRENTLAQKDYQCAVLAVRATSRPTLGCLLAQSAMPGATPVRTARASARTAVPDSTRLGTVVQSVRFAMQENSPCSLTQVTAVRVLPGISPMLPVLPSAKHALQDFILTLIHLWISEQFVC